MKWDKINDDMIIALPEEFDMNVNLGYLKREKMNVCMKSRTISLQE